MKTYIERHKISSKEWFFVTTELFGPPISPPLKTREEAENWMSNKKYQIVMKAKDADFSYKLKDIYETKAEAEKWQTYLSEQPQNVDYNFIIVEVRYDQQND